LAQTLDHSAPPTLAAIACKTCGQVHAQEPLEPGTVAVCVRCGSPLERRTRSSLHRTAAFALTALLLYIPANMFPILRLELYGTYAEDTVWKGVVLFFRSGNYLMAVIVFMASIFIPLLKLLGLFILVLSTGLRFEGAKVLRTWLYRMIEGIGRWAMLDVFVLSIWVAVVKLGSLATVSPGTGLLPFGGVVVFTLLASWSFDPQLIWEKEETTE
jgi:paraquat-inducible protein A